MVLVVLQENNFMVKDDSIRQQMFASIVSWQSSELSQKEWCRQQGISYHIFHYWYRKDRDGHWESGNANPFVRLVIKSEAAASCEVVFVDGTKILFREPVPAPYLKSLLF